MPKKITVKDICRALDATPIASENGLSLIYYHSNHRGYFLKYNYRKGMLFLGASMTDAVKGYNKALETINKGTNNEIKKIQ